MLNYNNQKNDNENENNENPEMEMDQIQFGVDDIVMFEEGLRVQVENKPYQKRSLISRMFARNQIW